jgi:HD-GYP domain-containing protein (c-di-GMP phosphodiesterase class II)
MAEVMSQLRLADLITALSVVTDLGVGRREETAMRACLIATRLSDLVAIDPQQRSDVYYTTLLRYVGCTAFAAEEAGLWGGDEIAARAVITRIDTLDPRELLRFQRSTVARRSRPLRRAWIATSSLPRLLLANRELVAAHCEVGSDLASRVGMSETVQAALRQVYERWDGRGFPRKLRGDALCLPVRFAQLASQVAAYLPFGPEETCAVVKRRAGADLDPELAAVFLRHSTEVIGDLAVLDVWTEAVEAEPHPVRHVSSPQVDEVAQAFADMADLKVPFLRGHSRGVAELAEGAAHALGLPAGERVVVRQAALFHDLGRVSVPNGIWEKPSRLTSTEWERVRLHSYYTERILRRSSALGPVAELAGMHHERQDGSGYHRHMPGTLIPSGARLVAAADVYQAMTQARPYRPAWSAEAAAQALHEEVRTGQLAREAVESVLDAAGQTAARRRRDWPAGLSDREVQVLRLIARGASYKDVAHELVIAPRTAAHHVQHIYTKIDVTSRAAAAMFAMKHELLQ